MDEKSLRVLEYFKIIELLASHAQSSLGREMCKNTRPIKDILSIKEKQDETQEARLLLEREGNPPLFGINNLRDLLSYAVKGGRLSPKNLLQIGDMLRASRTFIEYLDFDDEEVQYPIIQSYGEKMETFKFLEEEIDKAILSEDEISDYASANLRSIRSNLRRKSDEVSQRLNSLISSPRYKDILQDNIVTVREGRYVVPVKSERKSVIPGLIHGQSSSGHTVYIEPMTVVNINNEIKSLEADEEEEIDRILKRLSEMAASKSEEIIINQNCLQELDYIFARASLARNMEASEPRFNENGLINLKKARHPLLTDEEVVPISIRLGGEFNTLVITGPNTGGKTVSLKTIGLLELMAMSGLQIPADEGSDISIFENIYADIGDEQSIEQSLSTFSSHMTNIVRILSEVGSKDLVLFDELGAGTDPTEGAALAMAILNLLLVKNIRTMATTHYSQLKTYAMTTEGVENASVEFDVDTLSPTFRLMIGLPGKSNAFEISKRLGLDGSLIDSAKNLLSQEEQDFEEILQNMEYDKKNLEKEREVLKKEKSKLKTDLETLERKISQFESQRDKLLEEAKDQAKLIVDQALIDSKDILREMNTMRTRIDKSSVRDAHEYTDMLREKSKDLAKEQENILDVKSGEDIGEVKLGDHVEVLALGESGTVVEEPDNKGNLMVQIGILKINANIDGLRRVKSQDEKDSQTNIKNIIKNKVSEEISSELDLRGRNVEEAILEIDKYLDDALLSNMSEVRIIHGKGTGALRKGLDEYFRKNKLIKSTRRGEQNEGGSGVTVLKI